MGRKTSNSFPNSSKGQLGATFVKAIKNWKNILATYGLFYIIVVRQFFEEERLVGISLRQSCVVERTPVVTKISVRCEHNIHKEVLLHDSSCPDEFEREVICRVVHEFERSAPKFHQC